ncbi:Ig-like domain-containing protein [Rhodococcus sp. IEGM 1379]|uniref:Ig-like domain-containing protein n=1 Tax=Rhodococcus sp. IEGM 1379 TaxID=3047086 RepID=UPI0024B7345C|nr:Ig-like domain-containing protein [Rhodococcus sp. IEGM 1379]MDI9914565.1 Ig-like domain-containing protein [Rhodococcus sp. IEGM 1379]
MVSTLVRRGAVTAASLAGCLALVVGGSGISSAAPVDRPFTASCHGWQFPGPITHNETRDSGVTITAPAAVPPNSTFTYRIAPKPMTVPSSGYDLRNVVNWTRLKFDFDIPAGTTFVGAQIAAGTSSNLGGVAPSVNRINDNGSSDPNGAHLRISGNNITAGNGPSTSNNSGGGIEVGGGQTFQLPAVDVTVVSGVVGTQIKPMLRVTDTNSGSYDSANNYLTFLQQETLLGGVKYWLTTNCSPRDNKSAALNSGGQPLTTISVDSNLAQTETRISAPASAVVGDSIELTATVTPMPSGGMVQFRDGDVDLGAPVAVVNGVAKVNRTLTAAGDRNITAHYLGATGYMESMSGAVTVNVTEPSVPEPGSGSLGSLGFGS